MASMPTGQTQTDEQTDRQTNGTTPDHYVMLSARCRQCNNDLYVPTLKADG